MEDSSEYQEELYLDKKRREGWTLCPICEEWMHRDDYIEGASCCDKCEYLSRPMPNVLGLAGPKGVGKSTYAEKLSEEFGYKVISMATPIREMLRPLLSHFTEDPDDYLIQDKSAEVPGLGISSRKLLQTRGTEWGRKLRPTIWVMCAENIIKTTERQVVIDDVRFDNEAKMIRKLGGEVWRMSRKGFKPLKDSHVSEQGVDPDLIDREYEL